MSAGIYGFCVLSFVVGVLIALIGAVIKDSDSFTKRYRWLSTTIILTGLLIGGTGFVYGLRVLHLRLVSDYLNVLSVPYAYAQPSDCVFTYTDIVIATAVSGILSAIVTTIAWWRMLMTKDQKHVGGTNK